VGTQYWKYGPTLANTATHWYPILMGDNDGDNVITITLVDGGLGDDDLVANGVIVDQGGPGVPTYTLTYTAGANGTITAPATSPTTHDSGAIVTITASPNPTYHFVNWTGAVSTVADANAASTTITMNGDYSITANFAINTYTLTYTAGTGGTITAPATSPTTHNSGAIVTITASPSSGYSFLNWTGDVTTVANVNAASTTITMNGDYSITANFTHLPLSVGGIAQFPVDDSGSSSTPYAVIIGGSIAALAALALGVWFARRRWLRRYN